MLSNQYSIYNGVEQGGCLSPTLVRIYLNDLIRSSKMCYRYGNHYMGVYTVTQMTYFLFSSTLSGLKEMLKLCEDYAMLTSVSSSNTAIVLT